MPPHLVDILYTPCLNALGGTAEVLINTLAMIHMLAISYFPYP
jgi:hypothetical protein